MKSDRLLFVIHKHHATSLHYDFRLQIGDVMPSWAIPKGPTLDPQFKRLAMPTTDHGLDYRTFEGNISEGKYGAGPVMIWDQGYYIPEKEISKGVRETVDDYDDGQQTMKIGMEKGELKFQLFGEKLRGSFALIKTRGFGPKDSWLLIKHRDEHCKEGFDAKDYDTSAISGKSLEEIRNTA